jgi:hypothetical protein
VDRPGLVTVAAARAEGPRIWDWLMAGLAVFCALALPSSILQAVAMYRDTPDGVSIALGIGTVVVGAAWAYWMGVGSWRLTYWAKRSAGLSQDASTG